MNLPMLNKTNAMKLFIFILVTFCYYHILCIFEMVLFNVDYDQIVFQPLSLLVNGAFALCLAYERQRLGEHYEKK